MKMGQQIYEKEQASAGEAGDASSSEDTAADEEVVDAEFSEVEEDSDKKD